jgi:hypothetical protein
MAKSLKGATNLAPIIGPDPTAQLIYVFAQIDEYKLKESIRFAKMLTALGENDGQTAQGSASKDRCAPQERPAQDRE